MYDAEKPLTELVLFAGAGGSVYASRLLGHHVVAYVEKEESRCAILTARIADGTFDRAPVYHGTVEEFVASGCTRRYRGVVDLVSGGPPCQGFSRAGKHLGGADPRNSFPALLDVVREVRPRFVFVENSANLVSDPYFGRVLGDLAALGYDATWLCLRASNVGAPHHRYRLWLLGVRRGDGLAVARGHGREGEHAAGAEAAAALGGRKDALEHAEGLGRGRRPGEPRGGRGRPADAGRPTEVMGDSDCHEREASAAEDGSGRPGSASGVPALADSRRGSLQRRRGSSDVPRPAGVDEDQGLQRERRRDDAGDGGDAVADAELGRRGPNDPDAHRGEPDSRGSGAWPPLRDDREGWARILAERPNLAPALPLEAQRLFRRVADGLARGSDEPGTALRRYLRSLGRERRQRLAALGDGQVPLCAAIAFVTLMDEATR